MREQRCAQSARARRPAPRVEDQLLRQAASRAQASAPTATRSASLGTVTCVPAAVGLVARSRAPRPAPPSAPPAPSARAARRRAVPPDAPRLGQQLELVQAFVAVCRNRPFVLAAAHARSPRSAGCRPARSGGLRGKERRARRRWRASSEAGNLHGRPGFVHGACPAHCLRLQRGRSSRRHIGDIAMTAAAQRRALRRSRRARRLPRLPRWRSSTAMPPSSRAFRPAAWATTWRGRWPRSCAATTPSTPAGRQQAPAPAAASRPSTSSAPRPTA